MYRQHGIEGFKLVKADPIIDVEKEKNKAKKDKKVPIVAPKFVVADSESDNDDGDDEDDEDDEDNNNEQDFWDIISLFEWKLKSDGICEGKIVERITKEFSKKIDKLFKKKYQEKKEELRTKINEKILQYDLEKQNKILGHIIAMGNTWYTNILETPDLVEFIIEEMQDFDTFLPNYLK